MAPRARLVLGALAASTGLCLAGCTAGEAVPLASEVESIDSRLAALPGVETASATVDDTTGRIDVDVVLESDVTREELPAIAAEAAAVPDQPVPAGTYAGPVEITLGGSRFGFFGAGEADAVTAQLDYWVALARVGFERVTMSDLADSGEPALGPDGAATAAGGEPDDDGAAAADPASGSPTSSASGSPGTWARQSAQPAGRYVLLDLPDDADAAAAEQRFAAARAVADPGVKAGEWELSGFGNQVSAQFAQTSLPDSAQTAQFAGLGGHIAELDEHATIRYRADDASDPPRSVEMSVFDDGLADATRANAEERFQRGPLWQPLLSMLAELDATGLDYGLDVLANPLQDAGAFELELSVRDCRFHGDPDWPAASNGIGQAWLQHRASVDAHSVATGACAVAPLG